MHISRRNFLTTTLEMGMITTTWLATGCSQSSLQLPNTDIFRPDINPVPRSHLRQGGELNTYFDQAMPANWNYYHLDGNLLSVDQLCTATYPTPMLRDYRCIPQPNYEYLQEKPTLTWVNNKQTITYTIKPHLYYTDGTQVSWRDYRTIYLMNNGHDPHINCTLTTGYDQIESVRPGINEQQVIITFRQPYGDWAGLFPVLYPYHSIDTVEKFNTGWLLTSPPTCGPFCISTIDHKKQIITLMRNSQWRGTQAILDRINFFIIDSTSSIQAFKNGTLQAVPVQMQSDLALLAHTPHTVIRKSLNPKWFYLGFNANPHRLTSERALRQAIQMGIDTAFIRQTLIGSFHDPVPPLGNHIYLIGQAGYQDNSIPYNQQAAKNLLDAAGWKVGHHRIRYRNGTPLRLGILTRSDGYRERLIAEIIQTNLIDLGIQAVLHQVPSANFYPHYLLTGDYDLCISDWVATPGAISSSYSIYALYYKTDPTTGHTTIDMTRNNQNCGIVGNDRINQLFEQAMHQSDPHQQQALGNAIDQAIWEEGHSLPLFQLIEGMAQVSHLANFGENLYGPQRWQDVGYIQQ